MSKNRSNINDSGRSTSLRKDDLWETAPFTPGATYRRINLQTGLYEYGTLKAAAEISDGRLEGTMARHRHADLVVVAGTASFSEWELWASPAVLPDPLVGKRTEQYIAAVATALKRRATALKRLANRTISWEA